MPFSTSDDAVNVVRARLQSSELVEPVVTLCDSSRAVRCSSEFVAAIESGAADIELLEISTRDLAEIDLDFRLDLGLYEKAECRPEDIVEIEGLEFALAPAMLKYLDAFQLDHVDDNFVLKSGGRTYLRLADLPNA